MQNHGHTKTAFPFPRPQRTKSRPLPQLFKQNDIMCKMTHTRPFATKLRRGASGAKRQEGAFSAVLKIRVPSIS
eukprot:6489393-Amphidinium_carterae.1